MLSSPIRFLHDQRFVERLRVMLFEDGNGDPLDFTFGEVFVSIVEGTLRILRVVEENKVIYIRNQIEIPGPG